LVASTTGKINLDNDKIAIKPLIDGDFSNFWNIFTILIDIHYPVEPV